MAAIDLAWVDAPLVTVEERRERIDPWFWQSKVKGYNRVFQSFNAFGRLSDDKVIKVHVPTGFETDFYSIPGFARPLIPKSQTGWNQAAVVHDRMYFENTAYIWDEQSQIWTANNSIVRHTADQMLLALMERLGAPPFRKPVIYQAVRLGGRGPWNKRRLEQWQRLNRHT